MLEEYVCILLCMVTNAVHLKLVNDVSAEANLAARKAASIFAKDRVT